MSIKDLKLTAKDILEKEFKTGLKGYSQSDVDAFLDLIIQDYEIFHRRIDELSQENLHLQKQLENRKQEQPVKKAPSMPTAPTINGGTTTYDILRRLSNLEKEVFGSKLYDN